jgi:hypothetical protein
MELMNGLIEISQRDIFIFMAVMDVSLFFFHFSSSEGGRQLVADRLLENYMTEQLDRVLYSINL